MANVPVVPGSFVPQIAQAPFWPSSIFWYSDSVIPKRRRRLEDLFLGPRRRALFSGIRAFIFAVARLARHFAEQVSVRLFNRPTLKVVPQTTQSRDFRGSPLAPLTAFV